MDDFFTDPEAPSSSQPNSPQNTFNNTSNFMEFTDAASSISTSNRQLTQGEEDLAASTEAGTSLAIQSTPSIPTCQTLRRRRGCLLKRKASSTSTKATKTHHMGAKATSMTSMPNDLPIIKTANVFGVNGADELRVSPPRIATKPDALRMSSPQIISLLDSSDDDDDTDLIDLSTTGVDPLFTATGGLLNRTTISASALESIGKRDVPSQYSSAILVMPDEYLTGTIPTAPSQGASRNVRYLPLCPVTNADGHSGMVNNSILTIRTNHKDRIRRSENALAISNATWPLGELPVELFDLITTHLSRDDVKSMRMVSKEFEQKVSRSLFHTSVVPFNTELYDMIDEEKRSLTRGTRPVIRNKGKQKMVQADPPLELDAGGLIWQNAKEDKEGKVYKGHGLKVFQGFGPHIKRFGMTFEVSEKQLTQPPIKKELDQIDSYHGPYDWPSSHYARFANLAGLENTADETSKMKAAFANLDIVQELALAIESGLGWLNGPDKSMRSRIFERPSPVFGSKYDISDHTTAAAAEFWDALQASQQSFAPYSNIKEVSLEHRLLSASTPSQLDGISQTIYANSQRWSMIESGKVLPSRSESALSSLGVLYTTTKSSASSDMESLGSLIVPSSLRKEQKEWLLETQWAQQAFLES